MERASERASEELLLLLYRMERNTPHAVTGTDPTCDQRRGVFSHHNAHYTGNKISNTAGLRVKLVLFYVLWFYATSPQTYMKLQMFLNVNGV